MNARRALPIVGCLAVLLVTGLYGWLQYQHFTAREAGRTVLQERVIEIRTQSRGYQDCKAPVAYWIQRSALFNDAVDLLEIEGGYATQEFLDHVRRLSHDITVALSRIDFDCTRDEATAAKETTGYIQSK